MACFLVPATEAVVTTTIKKSQGGDHEAKGPIARRLRWLTIMLWGGSALLLLEHIVHGEIVPWFPFLTGAETAAGRAAIAQEIMTRGVAMAVVITAVWATMVAVSVILERRAAARVPQN